MAEPDPAPPCAHDSMVDTRCKELWLHKLLVITFHEILLLLYMKS